MNATKRASMQSAEPRKSFLAQAMFGTAFTYLTSGVFLSGLAILMGAGDLLVGYLSVVVNICGVLLLVFSAFLERFVSRKRLTIVLTILSRLATLFLVAVPALFPEQVRLVGFVAAVVVAFTLQAQATVALNQWMMGFIDEKKRGRYISLRQTLTLVVTVALSVTGGLWMDHMGGEYIGFVLLFAFAGLMGLLETAWLLRTPDSAAYRAERPAGRGGMLLIPLKDGRYRGFVVYILLFYLLLTVADSFTMVYLMKYLALPYRTTTMLYLLISLPQIALLGLWGKVSDRRGHHFALTTSVWLFAGETLLMSFVSPSTWFVFIPAAFLVAAVANSGFVVAVFNRRYELMPAENRMVYDNFYTAAIGLGYVLGPIVGGGIKGWIEAGPVADLLPFAGIRLLYPVSTLGILLLQLVFLRPWAHTARGCGDTKQ